MKKVLIVCVALITRMSVCAHEAKYQSNIGKAPSMGWNSWNRFGRGVSADVIRGMADGALRYGLNKVGYKYLVIDDAWQASELGPNGELAADPEKFPDGIAPLAAYVQKRGFELGIYACPNKLTYADFPGSLGYEETHARQFADWGCWFLKYDFCPIRSGELGLAYDEVVRRYQVMSDALHGQASNIIYARISACRV